MDQPGNELPTRQFHDRELRASLRKQPSMGSTVSGKPSAQVARPSALADVQSTAGNVTYLSPGSHRPGVFQISRLWVRAGSRCTAICMATSCFLSTPSASASAMPCKPDLTTALVSRRTAMKGCGAMLLLWDGLHGAPAWPNDLVVGAKAPVAHVGNAEWTNSFHNGSDGPGGYPDLLATWCAPCRDELPLLSRYAAQHAAAVLRILVSA